MCSFSFNSQAQAVDGASSFSFQESALFLGSHTGNFSSQVVSPLSPVFLS